MIPTDLAALCRKVIAPEANHLLTEPPNQANGFLDFGWFCKEHTIIANSVFTALGHPTNIIYGDITVVCPGILRLSTITSTEDKHFWCKSGEFPILDISINLRFYPNIPNIEGPVFNEGKNGRYKIKKESNRESHTSAYSDHTIIYTPLRISPDILIEPTDAHIAASISIHILDIIHGKAKSLIGVPPDEALFSLMKKHFDASQRITEIVKKAHNKTVV